MSSGRNVLVRISPPSPSLADWNMSSGRNGEVTRLIVSPSLADWDMSSGRNRCVMRCKTRTSLADWDMSSGRNGCGACQHVGTSLADWDMSSGRNPFASHLPSCTAFAVSLRRRLANGRAKARWLIKIWLFWPSLGKHQKIDRNLNLINLGVNYLRKISVFWLKLG